MGEAGGTATPLVRSVGRKRLAVFLLCLASFMAVVDDTIVTIALPLMQRELGFSGADAQWVLNGYVLAFGGLLLFCGRAADLWGRRAGCSWRVSPCSASRLCSGVFRRRRGFWPSPAHCRVSARRRS